MRTCEELLKFLEKNRKEEYRFLSEKGQKVDKYFIGYRNGYLSLYYMGMCAFKLEQNGDGTKYSTHRYYVQNSNIDNDNMSFEELKGEFQNICSRIRSHVEGDHDGNVRREKICQQRIINRINSGSSKWYCLDMEYIEDKNPCGRFDLIAVKRDPSPDGKHEVALVELKVGRNSYSGLNNSSYNEKKEKYDQLQHDMYNPELRSVKYGSGLVSHIVDFHRYVQIKASYKEQLRAELVEAIDSNKKLGLITKDNPLYYIENENNLADKPTIYIVTYSYVPNLRGDREKKVSLKSLKTSFYNYLYTSDFSLESRLNSNQIDGFLKAKKEFGTFKDNQQEDRLIIRERVLNDEYDFNIVFVDPDLKEDAFDCL